MVGVVVMMVVKETMIVAETHTRLYSFILVVILVYIHLPSWSFSFTFIYLRGHLPFSTDHARYLDGFS